ncbi:MAG: hypothetical protein NTW52_03925 [Planctomycetota bacterium]|nr:hypothetical protein [Planctomycetota bacterium]
MAKMRLNFGIGFLIVLMTSVAGFFTGYRYGGYAKDYEAAQIKVTSRVYDVSELVDRKNKMSVTTQLRGLAELFKAIVAGSFPPDTKLEIEAFESRLSLLITADGRTHDEIKDMIHSFATEIKKAKAKKSVSVIAP